MLLSFVLKFVVPILGVLALGFGIYEYGKSQGYDQGHQAAWDTQQQTINKMITADNAAADQNNQKIAGLELDAQTAQGQVSRKSASIQSLRTQIVTQYKKANAATPASACGWTAPAISAINQIIDAGQQTASGAAAASAPGVPQ